MPQYVTCTNVAGKPSRSVDRDSTDRQNTEDVGLRTNTKYTIYSIIIFLTSGIYFFLAYKDFTSQTIDIKTLDKFTGQVSERGTTERRSSKITTTVFYLTIDGLNQKLGIYRQTGNYKGLVDEIQPDDIVTVYYLGKSSDSDINIDLVQIDKNATAICNGWVKCKYKVLSSLLRLVTVDKYVFKNQPLQIAKRCVLLFFRNILE